LKTHKENPTVNTTSTNHQAQSDAPLRSFSDCHQGIVSHLTTLGELPAHVAAAKQAQLIADDTLKFFREAVFDHHAEEEKDLFPAVLSSATEGEERDRVKRLIQDLTAEHREIEMRWSKLEPMINKLAKGQLVDIDAASVEQLIKQYVAHADLEEREFLPLSEKILGRSSTQMAALGLSLHTRHVVRAARRGIRGS